MRTHYLGLWGWPTKTYRPACGTSPGKNPTYSDHPTCKRCVNQATTGVVLPIRHLNASEGASR